MACVAIQTGPAFLSTVLAHVDCQAQTLGAYGYGALADPGSTVSLALGGLLTIFIALIGVRLLTGHPLDGGDVLADILKVGVVLTLAVSWPAWRTIGYDVVLTGSGEVASTIGRASGLPGQRKDMASRLQNVDDGLVAMTTFGTGRLTGGVAAGPDLGDSFRGVALADQTGLGWGRVLFLAETIGPFALVRLAAGILLALAPLMAGLLLFGGTMGIFLGWLRALGFTALGAVSINLLQGVELAILEPWIADVLAQRDGGTITPAAPTELLVLTLAFAFLTAGTLFIIARLTFFPHLALRSISRVSVRGRHDLRTENRPILALVQPALAESPPRAWLIADAVSTSLRRDEMRGLADRTNSSNSSSNDRNPTNRAMQSNPTNPSETLGSSYRRTHRRTTAATERRDQTR